MSVQLKIRVTKDILKQTMHCPTGHLASNCAITVAIRELIPNAVTGSSSIWVVVNGKTLGIELPSIALDFIEKFDHSLPAERMSMKEIEFEVALPDEILQSINIDEVTEILQNHPTLSITESIL